MKKKNSVQTRTVRTKKRKVRKRVLFILLPAAVLFFGVLGYGIHLYVQAQNVVSGSYEDDGRDKSALREQQVDPDIDNVSILIIGVDSNEHRDNAESARSDALMLATFNKDDSSVNLVSIPRDSYVHIPEVGYEDKITHAHAAGGPKASIETVENLMDIPVDYYVRLNFHAFVDVVDALNGIDVEVPYEFTESDSMDRRDSIHLLPGEQTLNGEEALALARTRKLDNDIERGKRQMEIMNAIVDKAASVNSVLNYGDIITAIGDNMSTNMSFSEITTFASYITGGLNINNYTLEGSDYQPGSTYYWLLDDVALQETKTLLQDHLEISSPTMNTNATTQESQNSQGH